MERTTEYHTIKPFFSDNSEILILGSFPSVKSRETNFYYGHPQNRFWKVLAAVYGETAPETISEKQTLLSYHRVALWDVIDACSIEGSNDASIRSAVPNDLNLILKHSKVNRIFVNGKTAEKYYDRLILPTLKIKAVALPSTSPANAAFSLDKLIGAWEKIKNV